jgi:rhodanese-related sulfurtransferase
MMYDTTRSILPEIDKNSMILPAHWAWTSCGKWLSKQNMDTVGNQLKLNPMLQPMTREEFINELTSDQPSIPAYFTNSVLLNKKWNSNFNETYKKIKLIENRENQEDTIIIDTRTIEQTTNYPLSSKSINIWLHSNSFIGMLGTIVNPTNKFIIITEKKSDINKVISEILSIWYETNLLWIYCIEQNWYQKQMIHKHDLENTKDTVIIDIRSSATSQDNPLDLKSINIPLDQLSSKLNTLDKTKTYIPYCGWTYKSAIASSLLTSHWFKTKNLYSE